MAQKSVGGVAGVLGGLISPRPAAEPEQPEKMSIAADVPHKPESPTPRTSTLKTHARLGRPPGRHSGRSSPKEKLTIRIDAKLADAYRDWSWSERCQLGELIEQALRFYQNRKDSR